MFSHVHTGYCICLCEYPFKPFVFKLNKIYEYFIYKDDDVLIYEIADELNYYLHTKSTEIFKNNFIDIIEHRNNLIKEILDE